MVRIKWGGMLTRYVTVGVILVVALVGTVSVVQERGKQARIQLATTIAHKQAGQVPTSHTTTSPSGSSQTANTSVTTTQTASSTSPAAELPVTGPELPVVDIIGIGLLVGTIVSYWLSRRATLRLL